MVAVETARGQKMLDCEGSKAPNGCQMLPLTLRSGPHKLVNAVADAETSRRPVLANWWMLRG